MMMSVAAIVKQNLINLNLQRMDKVEVNKQIKLSEHLALPSEATLSQTSELDGVRLSPHFTLGELTVTDVKTKDGRSAQGDALLAKNIPSHVAIENLKLSFRRKICNPPPNLSLGPGPSDRL